MRSTAALGLAVTVHRPSIGPDSRTGAFNPHDHVVLAVRGCIELGATESDMPVQIAPVDFVARALVELSGHAEATAPTFHLVNRDSLTWTELFDVVGDLGYPMARLPLDGWRTLSAERAGETRNALAGTPAFLAGVAGPVGAAAVRLRGHSRRSRARRYRVSPARRRVPEDMHRWAHGRRPPGAPVPWAPAGMTTERTTGNRRG